MHQLLRTVPRQTVNDVFRAGLVAAHGEIRVASCLKDHPLSGPVYLVAIGKAAGAMSLGANWVLHEQIIRGLVITKRGHVDRALARDTRFHCIESGHPLPDSDSLFAGRQLCSFLEEAPRDAAFLFLISGGASSLVEVLPDGIGLDDLLRANRWLLGSGLDIAAVNRVRQLLSQLKGGGLLSFLKGRQTTALLVSDVAGDDPAIIGSGLLHSGGVPPGENIGLPDWLTHLLAGRAPQSRTSGNVRHHIVATIDTALEAAASCARESGLAVTIVSNRLAGDASQAGTDIAACLATMPVGVYLWGGETTVKLPEPAGSGGRNQHLALAAACALSGHEDITVLAAGTDGTDGPARYAGAIVDASTIAGGQARGLDPLSCLQLADAGTFLEASGDLLVTGPTGTNVMDMVVAYKHVTM